MKRLIFVVALGSIAIAGLIIAIYFFINPSQKVADNELIAQEYEYDTHMTIADYSEVQAKENLIYAIVPFSEDNHPAWNISTRRICPNTYILCENIIGTVKDAFCQEHN